MSELPSTGSGMPSGLRILVAGASGASGRAVSAALRAAGAQVIAVGSNPEHLQSAYANDDGVLAFACDLADAAAVRDLAERVGDEAGSIDGLAHLVGGWRGGKGIAGQTDEDWDFLHRNLVTTLRNTTRAFYDDLAASPHGRAVIVSATAVGSPTAGGANYAAAKAAAESWMFSMADGFRRDQAAGPGAKETSEAEHSAAVVLVIKALVDDRMRAGNPEKPFTGFTDVADLAAAVKNLFSRPAAEINGRRIPLV